MIPRYKRDITAKIWEQKNKFNIWLTIEILICEALENLGEIPKKSLEIIKKKAKFDIDRINQIEKDVKHDVIAFLTNLSENIGIESRFIHLGVTSSDILDTALSVQLKQSCQILKKELKELVSILKKLSIKHKKTQCIGRSHGIFAEPTTFGLKMLGKYCEFKRNYERLVDAEKNISVCSISGAVGTYANINPKIEKYVAKKLGLMSEDVSTQVIPRDRHAQLFAVLATIGSSIESLSIEIRHLQRSEVREVEEYFSKSQKGSSAMPHKKNPILSENLTGISRLIRASIIPSLENISLWHERDISHSSVERIICPDIIILTDFAINRMNSILRGLVVNKNNMKINLDKTLGLYNSQRVLIELTKKGLSRENAYKIVQQISMKSWESQRNFRDLLDLEKKITEYLSKKDLDKIFDINYHFKNVEYIYKKVLKKS